jgi:hypothetical protein
MWYYGLRRVTRPTNKVIQQCFLHKDLMGAWRLRLMNAPSLQEGVHTVHTGLRLGCWHLPLQLVSNLNVRDYFITYAILFVYITNIQNAPVRPRTCRGNHGLNCSSCSSSAPATCLPPRRMCTRWEIDHHSLKTEHHRVRSSIDQR